MHVYRDENIIRIISARKADPKERRFNILISMSCSCVSMATCLSNTVKQATVHHRWVSFQLTQWVSFIVTVTAGTSKRPEPSPTTRKPGLVPVFLCLPD
ncbi:MAG: hypothetical protein KDI15_11305, partial [Thiothrix sp.]|nr:hypothetical protein [Thiothrix sp.]